MTSARHSAGEGPSPGQLIDLRYRLIRTVGAGGMGTVWEAEHEALGRRFALKLLRNPRAMTGPMVARFQREARTAAAIDHPNVVRVVDYHVDPSAGPYLVMELLLGETLAAVMDSPLGLREAVEWLAPVAGALDAIHAHGLVHRDVKPENILRTRHDAGATVKLADFGLAAHADGRDRITRQGMLVGTPLYMAPEAAEGDAMSPAGDVYALAVIAFELLTGGLPHEGESALEILSAKLTTPPPSLAERSGRMFTLALECAFDDGLHRDPGQRPKTAGEFVHRLAAAIRR